MLCGIFELIKDSAGWFCQIMNKSQGLFSIE